MRIKFNKTGLFAVHPVYGPIVACKEGAVGVLPDDQAQQLIGAQWALGIDYHAKSEEQPTIDDAVVPPWETPWWNPKAKNAKDQLEAFCLETFNVDLDKRKSVKSIILELKELLAAK